MRIAGGSCGCAPMIRRFGSPRVVCQGTVIYKDYRRYQSGMTTEGQIVAPVNPPSTSIENPPAGLRRQPLSWVTVITAVPSPAPAGRRCRRPSGRFRVQVAGRLVGQDDAGAVGEGAGDGDALALAAGELCRQLAGVIAQRPSRPAGPAPAAQLRLRRVAAASAWGSSTLPSTVNSGSRKWNWNTKPSVDRRTCASSARWHPPCRGLPAATVPEVGRSSRPSR